ncbi:hypothetical protein ACFX2A_040677 [Malus domestica]
MPGISLYDQAKTSAFSCKKEISDNRRGGDKVVPIFTMRFGWSLEIETFSNSSAGCACWVKESSRGSSG